MIKKKKLDTRHTKIKLKMEDLNATLILKGRSPAFFFSTLPKRMT
jgi:hypothetical protein